MASDKTIEVEYEGYKGTSIGGRLFTVSALDDNLTEYMAVWNLPITTKKQCKESLLAALRFLVSTNKIPEVKGI